MRRSHFQVEGIRFDGATKAIVTVEAGTNTSSPIVRVRAHRRQREAVSLLSDIAQIVLERDAKALAATHANEKRRGRRSF